MVTAIRSLNFNLGSSIRIGQTRYQRKISIIGNSSSDSRDRKLMDKAIERFVKRLSLPEGFLFKMISCKENKNAINKFKSEISRFNKESKGSDNLASVKILQLYHAQRTGDNSESICNEGFYSFYGNKGRGVYLANHSRYSWNWAGTIDPVLICDVIADDSRISRYRSEIYSPKWDSEYVCHPLVVFPKYVLKYEIQGKFTDEIARQIGYVKHGSFGCISCDSEVLNDNTKGIRCDCELVPKIDPRDVLEEN